MDGPDGRQAARDLATIRMHQERARRATRVPWWFYLAMFVVGAGVMASNDFFDGGGTKLVPIVIIVLLVLTVVYVIILGGRSAPLSRLRGVQRRQTSYPPYICAATLIIVVGAFLFTRYGGGVVDDIAGATGLHDYPNTVAGVLYSGAFTLLFALYRLLITRYEKRTNR